MSTRQVFQVIDRTDVFMTTVPTTVTAPKTGKVYNVLNRIRVQQHTPTKCQCRASATGCGRSDYIAEFFVVQTHHTKINSIIIAFTYMKGLHKDGTHQYLSENAKIVTATVDDTVADDQTHPPSE